MSISRSTIAILLVGTFVLSLLAFQSPTWGLENSEVTRTSAPDVKTAAPTDVRRAGGPEGMKGKEPYVIQDEKTGGMGMSTLMTFLIPVFGILGLIFTFMKSKWVAEQEVGTEKMARIASNITEGAMSFLKAEYSILIVFVIAVAALLGYAGTTQESSSPLIALSFILGAFCSAFAGFIGMKVATKANVRTTNAARDSLGKALDVAFSGG